MFEPKNIVFSYSMYDGISITCKIMIYDLQQKDIYLSHAWTEIYKNECIAI